MQLHDVHNTVIFEINTIPSVHTYTTFLIKVTNKNINLCGTAKMQPYACACLSACMYMYQ